MGLRSRVQLQAARAGARSSCRAAAVRGLSARLASTARSSPRADGSSLITEVERFNKESALEESLTAPASWYTEPDFLRLEECAALLFFAQPRGDHSQRGARGLGVLRRDAVFGSAWMHVGHTGDVAELGQFFTGKVLNQPYIVVRGEKGKLVRPRCVSPCSLTH